MAFLTDRTLATGVTLDNLIHIVVTGDTSQNPAGSSYKATMGQVLDLINPTTITGGTYDSLTGTITFYDDTGGSFNVTGLVTGYTNTEVTGFTYDNANTFTIFENDGSTHSATFNILTGLTVSGSLSASTLNISSTPSSATGLTEVLIRDTILGEVKTYDFTHANFGLFVQTGNSTTVSATTSELTLVDGGIGSLSIPANFFNPGDSFRVRMGGIVSAANSETLIVRVKSGTVVLGSDTISFPNTSNRSWVLDIDFTIRTIGGTGVASIVSNGVFAFNRTSDDLLGGGFVTINNTTFDTTISNTLDITAEWSSNNASNSIYSVNFVLTKTF